MSTAGRPGGRSAGRVCQQSRHVRLGGLTLLVLVGYLLSLQPCLQAATSHSWAFSMYSSAQNLLAVLTVRPVPLSLP